MKKMTLTDWTRLLKSGRKFYKTADLVKLSGLSYPSCRVTLSRLVQRGFLVKLGKEFYGSGFVPFSPEEAVCQAYLPSYLSCEYALSRHGLIDQMPATYTAVTTRRSRKGVVGQAVASYEHLRKKLFWGYDVQGEAFIATPEKALLDWIYLRGVKGKGPDLDEIHWEELNLKTLKLYARRFPPAVRKLIGPFLKGLFSEDRSSNASVTPV